LLAKTDELAGVVAVSPLSGLYSIVLFLWTMLPAKRGKSYVQTGPLRLESERPGI
jgi:hypothetical protein